MSATPPNPLPPDEDRGPRILGMFWTMVAISTVMLSLRFHVRLKIRSIGWDDWMMLLTWALFIIGNSFITYSVSNGGGRHVWYLTQEQILKARMWSILPQPPIVLCFATAKTSVAILILRFVGRVTFWRRMLLIFMAVTVLILSFVVIVLLFAQCTPARALWAPEIEGAHCWDPRIANYFFNFTSGWNVFVDVVLAVLPATFIPSLNMQRGKKIALCMLLSLGIFAAICGAVKIKYLVDLTERIDFTWIGYDVEVWSEAEAFLLIFCGCVPTLTPLWDRFVTHKLDSNYGRTPLNNGGSASTPSGTASLGTAPYSRFGSSRGVVNSTTVRSESQTELGPVPPLPETVRVTNTYTVNHN